MVSAPFLIAFDHILRFLFLLCKPALPLQVFDGALHLGQNHKGDVTSGAAQLRNHFKRIEVEQMPERIMG
jgi:hypothetical protein